MNECKQQLPRRVRTRRQIHSTNAENAATLIKTMNAISTESMASQGRLAFFDVCFSAKSGETLPK